MIDKMFVPDYLYYRLAVSFFKKDGIINVRAMTVVSVVYIAFLWMLFAFVVRDKIWLKNNSLSVFVIVCLVIVIVQYFNFKRYCRIAHYLHDKWSADTLYEKIYKSLFVLSIAILILYLLFVFSEFQK